MTEKKISIYLCNKRDIKDAEEIKEIVKQTVLKKYPENIECAEDISDIVKYDIIAGSVAKNNKDFEEQSLQFADEIHQFVLSKLNGNTKNTMPMFLALKLINKGLVRIIAKESILQQ